MFLIDFAGVIGYENKNGNLNFQNNLFQNNRMMSNGVVYMKGGNFKDQ